MKIWEWRERETCFLNAEKKLRERENEKKIFIIYHFNSNNFCS